jgi:hypothetical protein
MMGFDQTVEQRLIRGSPYLVQLDGLDVVEGADDRRLVDEYRLGPLAVNQWIQAHLPYRWQLDQPGAVEHE